MANAKLHLGTIRVVQTPDRHLKLDALPLSLSSLSTRMTLTLWLLVVDGVNAVFLTGVNHHAAS